jgi:Mg2+/Co2+ transporter CorB
MDSGFFVPLSILGLIVLSGFFSGSETGITAASRAKIHRLAMEGNKRADMVRQLRDRKDRLIGAILLGNNVVNILASALATGFAIRWFGDDGIFYATIVMTLLILIFAEVLPKTYAFHHSEKVALSVAPALSVLVKLLAPVTASVQYIVNHFLRLFALRSQKKKEETDMSGTDVLRGAIDLHHQEGTVVRESRLMLDHILDLGDRDVDEVMVHRKDIYALNGDLSAEYLVSKILDSPHTRIPIWQENQDNIVGVMHVSDVLKVVKKGQPSHDELLGLLTKPWFIPENTTLFVQLSAFRERRHHFALVVDEYGALLGAITLEDILEEIVGKIDDERDVSQQSIVGEAEDCFLVEGKVTIRDLNRQSDWQLPARDAVTVAGLLIHEAESIPEEGDVYIAYGYRFEVVSKEGNQITAVRVQTYKEESG